MPKKRKISMVSTAIMNKHTGEILMRSCSRGEHLKRAILRVCEEFGLTEKDIEFSQSILKPTHEGG